MMYYRISKNEKILFFGKKIAQVWAVTLITCYCFYKLEPQTDINASTSTVDYMHFISTDRVVTPSDVSRLVFWL